MGSKCVGVWVGMGVDVCKVPHHILDYPSTARRVKLPCHMYMFKGIRGINIDCLPYKQNYDILFCAQIQSHSLELAFVHVERNMAINILVAYSCEV